MKKKITLIAIILLVACKQDTNKDKITTSQAITEGQKKGVKTSNAFTADYSSLFDTYACDVSIADLAKVLQIPETDIKLSQNSADGHCVFNLKGFGIGYENTGTTLRFGPVPSRKSQSKKDISIYLKEKAEMPNGKMIMGRDIILADAGGCYIMLLPANGRTVILSENYDNKFVMTYGSKASVQGRTAEQHDQLKIKAKDLANYLVTAHKK